MKYILRCDSSIYMFTKRVTAKRSLKCHVRFVPQKQATSVLGKASENFENGCSPSLGETNRGQSQSGRYSTQDLRRGLEAEGVSVKLYAFLYKSQVQGQHFLNVLPCCIALNTLIQSSLYGSGSFKMHCIGNLRTPFPFCQFKVSLVHDDHSVYTCWSGGGGRER